MLRIYFDKVVDYNLGKRETAPTWDEAKGDANAFFNLRIAASYFSPAAPSFDSPYQSFISAYRQANELLKDNPNALADPDGNPRTADEWFLDTYGEAYFPLTQSLSKSMDGVPPTLEGRAARQKYVDLIEKHPELGSLIVGNEGAGEFAGAVYDAQHAERVAPGSPFKQREGRAFDEARSAPDVRRGWIEFGRVMDLIDAERINRGLPNLQVAAARDLAHIKREFIRVMGEKNEAWFADFGVTDRNKMNRRIGAMREIVQDKRLSGREDIRVLGEYLRIRDAVTSELRNRKAAGGSSTLDSTANQDLALTWDTLVGKLLEGPGGLAFGDLYHRWLERDQLEAP